jgi:hypothetical protein
MIKNVVVYILCTVIISKDFDAPDVGLRVRVKLPEEAVLHEVDLSVPAPHKHRVHIGGDAGKSDGHVLGEAGLGLLIAELPVLVSCTQRSYSQVE